MELSAKNFYNVFTKRINANELMEERLKMYKENEPEWTIYITKLLSKIVTEDFGLEVQQEKFRVDVIGYKPRYLEIKDESSKYSLKPHLWELKMAIEHENNKKDWTDEVIKLAQLRSDLKVVIGYNNYNLRDEDEKNLNFVADCLNKLQCFRESRDEFLIILGNGINTKSKKSDYPDFGYCGYLYNQDIMCFNRLV